MLNFNGVSLRRGTRLLFSAVNLVIHRGYKLGLTGANGTGKSSFLQLILGGLSTDEGSLEMPADLVVASVAQETTFDARPALEIVLDGDQEFRQIEAELNRDAALSHGIRHAELLERMEQIGGYSIRARAARLMQGLGFRDEQQDRPARELSGGWRMRLNLAKALMCRSDLLLLDEPTNHLDLDAVIWLQDWLKNYPGTLILISHDREFLDEVTDHIAHIEDLSIRLYSGNYSAFEKIRAERLAQQESTYLKQQREIRHIQSFVDRFRAKATKAKQAQSRLKALQRMELIVRARSDSPFTFCFQTPSKTPDPLIKLGEVGIGYGQHTILDSLDLCIRPGDRIGLLGPNGAGKSTLIKLLAGEIRPLHGTVETAKDLDVGYFAQHQLEQLDEFESPLEHLQRIDRLASDTDLRSFLGTFAFSGERALNPVRGLSGGEKARLVLALLAYRRPNLLLLDEPTNHLDIQVRDALSIALQDYPGALVMVSHDRHLLRTLTDVFYLIKGGVLRVFEGDLDDYRDILQEKAVTRPEKLQGSSDARRNQRRSDAARRERLRPLRVAVENAEKDLERLQNRFREIELALGDATLYRPERKEELRVLLLEKRDLERALAESEEVWMQAQHAFEEAEQDSAPGISNVD
ncbi:MAG: ATP-binding cassette domain-containing protein [Gammaproteobacteria bacterium]